MIGNRELPSNHSLQRTELEQPSRFTALWPPSLNLGR